MLNWVVPALIFAVGLVPVSYFLVNARLSHRRSRGRRVAPAAPTDITVVVPVHAEPVDPFRQTLRSLARQGSRIVVVGDGCDEPYRSLAAAEGAEFVSRPARGGKKRALATGLREVHTPFVLFVDSDTVLAEGAVAALSTYFEPKVGGVGANLYVEGTGSIAAGSAEFFERSREVVLRAMSSRGNVLYLDGACMMYRTELIRSYVLSEEFQELRVLGRPTRLGDDWLLTDHVLEQGYRTVKAYDVGAVTRAPQSLVDFAQHNLRWSRSSWIRFGRYLRGLGPRNAGLFYRWELLATYALPLISLALLVARLPTLFHWLSLTFHQVIVLVSAGAARWDLGARAGPWDRLFFATQTVTGLVGAGSFVGAVADRLPRHRRLRTLACGLISSGLLFVMMIYGLVTFWKSSSWRDDRTVPGAPLPSFPPAAPRDPSDRVREPSP